MTEWDRAALAIFVSKGFLERHGIEKTIPDGVRGPLGLVYVDEVPEKAARKAYELADILLAERDK